MLKKRLAVSISSWFCIPEQGMKDFEILCRGSAFLVPTQNDFSRKFHVITTSHIVAPWRWRNYFNSAEWLQEVNENHVHYTVEVRDDDGVFILQQELLPQAYHHSTRDLAVLHLEAPDPSVGEIDLLRQFNYHPLNLFKRQEGSTLKIPVGTQVAFHGHEMTSATSIFDGSSSENSVDDRRPVPRIVGGSIQHHTQHQVFAKTSSVLSEGMCGGPVVVIGGGPAGTEEGAGAALGVLEGIVPTDHSIVALRGSAVYVEADVIAEFVDDIEHQRENAVKGLTKGEAWLHVGKDQDPEKMDLQRLHD